MVVGGGARKMKGLVVNAFILVLLVKSSETQRLNLRLPLDPCTLKPFKTGNLTRANSWSLSSDVFCLGNQNTTSDCRFTFSFCQSLQKVLPHTECENSSVCLIRNDKGTVMNDLAVYNPSKAQFIHAFNGDSFMTYFDVGGTNYTNTTTNVTKAVGVGIYFHCDMSVPWIPEAGKLQNDVPGNFSVRWDDRAFNYLITVHYMGACNELNPSDQDVIPAFVVGLSAGTILIIILACGVALYCLLGCTVKACSGHEGANVIPNNELWTNLPGYTMDGCSYFWSLICCCFDRGHRPSDYQPQKGYDSI